MQLWRSLRYGYGEAYGVGFAIATNSKPHHKANTESRRTKPTRKVDVQNLFLMATGIVEPTRKLQNPRTKSMPPIRSLINTNKKIQFIHFKFVALT